MKKQYKPEAVKMEEPDRGPQYKAIQEIVEKHLAVAQDEELYEELEGAMIGAMMLVSGWIWGEAIQRQQQGFDLLQLDPMMIFNRAMAHVRSQKPDDAQSIITLDKGIKGVQ